MKNYSIIVGLLILSTLGMAAYTYLDPIAGDDIYFREVGCSQAYQCIDEGHPPSTTDYIHSQHLGYGDCDMHWGPENQTISGHATFEFEDLPETATQVDYIVLYYYARTHQIIVGLPDGGFETITKNKVIPLLEGYGIDSYVDYGHIRYTNPVYQYYSVAYQLNPMTGEAWTVDEVNELRAGLCLEDSSTGPRIAQMDMLVSYD